MPLSLSLSVLKYSGTTGLAIPPMGKTLISYDQLKMLRGMRCVFTEKMAIDKFVGVRSDVAMFNRYANPMTPLDDSDYFSMYEIIHPLLRMKYFGALLALPELSNAITVNNNANLVSANSGASALIYVVSNPKPEEALTTYVAGVTGSSSSTKIKTTLPIANMCSLNIVPFNMYALAQDVFPIHIELASLTTDQIVTRFFRTALEKAPGYISAASDPLKAQFITDNISIATGPITAIDTLATVGSTDSGDMNQWLANATSDKTLYHGRFISDVLLKELGGCSGKDSDTAVGKWTLNNTNINRTLVRFPWLITAIQKFMQVQMKTKLAYHSGIVTTGRALLDDMVTHGVGPTYESKI
jgi:hypothetical protein